MRLLQIHEYLDLFPPDGASTAGISPAVVQTCLRAVETVWARTGLGCWDHVDRGVYYTSATADGRYLLAHIDADHSNCFVIVAYNLRSQLPESYIVFDIGAEYADPVLVCPGADYEGPATDELIETWVPRLASHSEEPIIVLDRGHGTYLLAEQKPDGSYIIEHQLVTSKNRYVALAPVTAEAVIEAFKSYAFKVKEWTRAFRWVRVEVP
ncbi:hypothetical protein [Montanilutibacter psychrotolerans]|uniref:Uncharacterized protein n=1 Tax=Montanilutibacter psychrotolerans TaxID=1327343 RepID=A0A3M8SZ73_9GAMM|nr:hypothetical protein [Lysobacter psychrotolerans]RNF83822.1 hypothetical protein EER27_10705 [Lysobacter psychrotolerans]